VDVIKLNSVINESNCHESNCLRDHLFLKIHKQALSDGNGLMIFRMICVIRTLNYLRCSVVLLLIYVMLLGMRWLLYFTKAGTFSLC
jgi:hypothetical protein